MRLRNKKTGEIVVFGEGIVDLNQIGCKNVAEMIEAGWEDYYEGPKDNFYWYLDGLGRTHFSSDILDEIEGRPNDWMARKIFGNYFETKEEAKLAVQKLKAFKRLKDKGFKFTSYGCYDIDGEKSPHIDFSYPNFDDLLDDDEVVADLDLLFVGEEEDE